MITTFQTFKAHIIAQDILLVGGAPSAANLSAREYESFDRIIRVNNFKYANECKRTDIWYSYFGRNIKAIDYRIKNEDIKLIVCKYPVDMEFCWIYTLRKELWEELPQKVCIPNERESFQTNNPFNISPTVGFSAIFNILASKPNKLTIVGFDFFESGKHNLDEEWDKSGGHTPQFEKKIVEVLEQEKRLVWQK